MVVMASAGVNNVPAVGEGGLDPAVASEECRLRRRRRLAPVASAADEGEGTAASVQSPPPSSASSFPSSEGSLGGAEEGSGVVLATPAPLPAEAAVWPVAFGSVALAGWMREMEDTVSLRPSFCAWADGSPMHFFAVFDGHGGPHGANARDPGGGAGRRRGRLPAAGGPPVGGGGGARVAGGAEAELRAVGRAGGVRVGSVRVRAGDAVRVPAVGQPRGAIVGSTAGVALLVRDRLFVANCGDSRAVLCRAGAGAVPLSEDQKKTPGRLLLRGAR